MNDRPVLQAKGLTKHFHVRSSRLDLRPRVVHAVDQVNLELYGGETVALVGESGCGKSTLARMLLRLIEPTSGSLQFCGQDLLALRGRALLAFRKHAQIVFQDPSASLNPRKTIFQILRDPMRLHGVADASNVLERAAQVLERVGLSPASAYLGRNPHEFSGGQRQRIGIARAISVAPTLVVGDEPVSALDISVRAEILELLKRLQREQQLTLLLITHDLAVVRSIAHRALVMYLGQVVETGPVEPIFQSPLHPYTQALLAATPIPDPKKARQRERLVLSGEIPSAANPPPGCRFHTRCPFVMDKCRTLEPPLLAAGPERQVACHLVHAPKPGT